MLNVLFSDEDKDLLDIRWSRHTAGYAFKGSRKISRYAHRIVMQRMLGRNLESSDVCDHINRNKLDNRRENLRLADKSLNSVNRVKRPDNKSGYVGVHLYWPKEYRDRGWAKRWKFIIQRKGLKTFYSKGYKTPKDAYEARQAKLREYIN